MAQQQMDWKMFQNGTSYGDVLSKEISER